MVALERIENIPCLPILPEELFFYAYPEALTCSNPSCCNSLSQLKFQEAYHNHPGLSSGLSSHTYSVTQMNRPEQIGSN